MSKPKQYTTYGDYLVTENKKERTVSIYSKDSEFLSTVDDGELNAELDRLGNEA